MNNNIQEDRVSYKVAKLLREKGFDTVCQESFNPTTNEPQPIISQSSLFAAIARPTQALAVKWIRENFNIHIFSEIDWEGDKLLGYCYHIQEFDGDTESISYKTSEDAIEAALEHILTKLI